MKRIFQSLCVLLLVVTLAGCAGFLKSSKKPVYPNKVTAEMKAEYDLADQNYFAGKLKEATSLFQNYISAYGYNELTDDARYKVGEIYFKNRNYKTALTYYRDAFSNIYNPEISPRAQYKAALTLTMLSKPNDAFSVLEMMDHKDLAPSVALDSDSLALTLGARMGKKRDDLIKWYLFLLDDYAKVGFDKYNQAEKKNLVSYDDAHQQVISWVNDANVTKGSVESLPVAMMKKQPSGGYVTYKLAMVNYAHGDFGGAEKYLKQFIRGYPKHEFNSNATNLLAELKGKVGDKLVKIGVILPLSGRFSMYGNSTLHGIQCAAGLTPPCTSPLNVELVVKDSAGDPGIAMNAVSELVKEGVVGIVGPLLSSTVDPVARKAEQEHVPLVTLSQKNGVADIGDYIFSHSLTPRDQVDTLVDYSVNKRGLKRYGILSPANTYGRVLANMFKAMVQSSGGEVVFERVYEHNDLKVSDSVKEMGGVTNYQGSGSYVDGANRKFAVPSNVEALFIPDSYKAVRYVVLAVHNESKNLSPNLLFMGVNRWNNPGLLTHDLGLLEGAIFVDGFFKNSVDVSTRHFVQNFLNAFGMEPTILEAQAFDAAKLMITGVQEGGINRDKLRAALRGIRNMTGATGNIKVSSNGDSSRKLFILTVKNGAITELSSARGIIKDENAFPYSKVSRMNSNAKYEGKKVPDLTVRTDTSKYEPLEFYNSELEE